MSTRQKPLKIAFVVNNVAREQAIFERITAAVIEAEPSTQCHTWLKSNGESFEQEILEFCPDIVVTFPLTTRGAHEKWYRIKYFTGCILVCYRTEGLISPRADAARIHAGQDQYGRTLVDYEVFWGNVARERIGEELVSQGRLSSIARTAVVGYPRFEHIREFHERGLESDNKIDAGVHAFLSKVPRNQRALFISGFHFADYTDDHIHSAGDLDLKDWSKWVEYRGAVQQYREEWCRTFEATVRAWPSIQFVLKKHPMEVKHCLHHNIPCFFEHLKKYPNVMIVENQTSSLDLVQNCGVLFHYGSTVSFEAYLCNTVTLLISGEHIFDKCKYRPRVEGCSLAKIEMSEAADVIGRWQRGELESTKTPEVDQLIRDVFNITDIASYFPSRDFASFLLGPLKRQTISLLDPYFRRQVYLKVRNVLHEKRRKVKARIKRLAGVAPDHQRKAG